MGGGSTLEILPASVKASSPCDLVPFELPSSRRPLRWYLTLSLPRHLLRSLDVPMFFLGGNPGTDTIESIEVHSGQLKGL